MGGRLVCRELENVTHLPQIVLCPKENLQRETIFLESPIVVRVTVAHIAFAYLYF